MRTSFMAAVAGCVALALPAVGSAKSPVPYPPLQKLVGPPSADQVVLIVEDTEILPNRGGKDMTGTSFTQVDLTKKHSVMDGFNDVWIGGQQIRDGEVIKDKFAPDAPRTAYQLFGAPGPYDYALTFYSRSNGAWLENQCYYESAIVFRLKPGVINYIPKTLQPPLYDGRPVDTLKPDTTELRRVLARFPMSQMEVALPDVVAIVKFSPDKFDRAMGGNKCSYKDDFTITHEFMPVMPVK